MYGKWESKLQQAADIEGFDSIDNMLESATFDSVCPAICTSRDCDYCEQLEPDGYGECPECGGKLRSVLLLAGIICLAIMVVLSQSAAAAPIYRETGLVHEIRYAATDTPLMADNATQGETGWAPTNGGSASLTYEFNWNQAVAPGLVIVAVDNPFAASLQFSQDGTNWVHLPCQRDSVGLLSQFSSGFASSAWLTISFANPARVLATDRISAPWQLTMLGLEVGSEIPEPPASALVGLLLGLFGASVGIRQYLG